MYPVDSVIHPLNKQLGHEQRKFTLTEPLSTQEDKWNAGGLRASGGGP